MEIQLGFFQIHHVYEVSLVMAKSGFVENVGGYEQEDEPVPNINCRMVRMEISGETIEMAIKFKTVKEKLVREKIVLKSGEDKVSLELVARVFGVGKRKWNTKAEIRNARFDTFNASSISRVKSNNI